MSNGFHFAHYPLDAKHPPTGWRLCSIRDICGDPQPGFASGRHNKSGNGIIHLRPMNIDPQGNLVFENSKYVNTDDLRRVSPGDILFNNTNSPAWVGKTAPIINQGDLAYSNHMTRLRPINGIDSRFVAWQLHYLQMSGYFRHLCANHVNQASISSDVLADAVPLLLPPSAEQQRITDRLDELLSDLSAGVAALERVKRKLARYRAAVLHAAVTGRLGKNNCEFTSIRIDSLIGPINQGWSPRCDLNRVTGFDEWGVIKTTAVQPMYYDDSESKPLSDNLTPRPQLEIKQGDFLMTRKGPRNRTGVCCYIRATRARLMVCDTVYRFRCNDSIIVPEYLEIALNSPVAYLAFDKQKAGIDDSGVSLTHKKVRGIELPVPSIADQLVIVDTAHEKLSQIDDLRTEIEHNLIKVQSLRQSILKAAFEGRLILAERTKKP